MRHSRRWPKDIDERRIQDCALSKEHRNTTRLIKRTLLHWHVVTFTVLQHKLGKAEKLIGANTRR